VAAQIARALEAAHAADVVHRDLKPANVMLVNRNDQEDFVKVLDFGISKDLDLAVGAALTRPDVAIGTPAYMAPEQAAGKTADALTDVYALGGLLYEMLTRTPPCSGDDAIEVLQRKATEDPRPIGELRSELPRDVQKLVMRALARAPGDRHWSMTALKEQILACLTTVEGAPSPRGPSGSLTTPRLPLGSADTAIGQPLTGGTGATTTAPVRRVRLGGTAILLTVLLAGGVLAGVHFLGTGPAPTAAPSPPPAAALAAVPAALPASPPPLPLAVGPTPAPTVSPAANEEPRKLLAAAAHHAIALDLTPAVLHAPAAHRASLAAGGEPHAAKTASGAPALPPASLADTTTILNRGQSAFDRGDYQEAIRQGRQAIAAGAEINGRLLVGDVYFHLERYREALREYNAAVARDPTDSSARRRRDLAREKAGQADAP
jgi:serine/threonine-protein kinase